VGTIADSRPYWLELLPYTFSTDLPGTSSGTQNAVPLFPQLQGWQTANDPATAVGIYTLGVTPLPGVRVQVQADGTSQQWDTGAWPWDLEAVPTRAWAIRALSATLLNTTPTPYPNVQVRYTLAVWREPIAERVLRGWRLTEADAATAKAVGLNTQATAMRGTHPLDLDTIIAETYRNRQIAPSVAASVLTQPTISQTQFYTLAAHPGELLVLRRIAVAGDLDDGITVVVDRDSNPGHVQVTADGASWDHPFTMLVPAVQTLTFSIRANRTVAGTVPVRVEVWRLALSNILGVRLNLLTEATLAGRMGASAAQGFVDRVRAGVI